MFRLTCVLLLVALTVACDQPQSGRRAGGQRIVQTLDKETGDQLRELSGQDQNSDKKPDGGESSDRDPATNNPSQPIDDPGGETPADQLPGDNQNQSPIDQALQELNEKEVTDPQQEPEIEPREIHEALTPLIEPHWKRLHPGYEVWFDTRENQVIVGGRISLRAGMLEMFACPMGTKEHESIIATVSDAEMVHAGLLAVGALPGRPARWMPEYVPAMGPECDISVIWGEGDDVRKVKAQEMIFDRSTGETLDHQWVFCGSRVWVDPDDPGYREYQANWGELICVSNFPSATLDLTVESSDANNGLRFQALPDKIPALGTPVLIVIKPDLTTNPSEEELNEDPEDSGQKKVIDPAKKETADPPAGKSEKDKDRGWFRRK